MKKWTKDACYAEAQKYTTLKDFRKQSQGAYITSWKNGWTKNYSWLCRFQPEIKWTEQAIIDAAKSCKTLKEFRTNFGRAYKKAKKTGLLPKLNWLEKMSYDMTKPIWLVYVYIIRETYAYVGITIDIKRRDLEHTRQKKDNLYKFCQKLGIVLEKGSYKIIEKDLVANDALDLEDKMKWHYQSMGYTIINIRKTGIGSGSLGSGIRKWRESECYEAASSCKSRVEFKKRYPRAYYNALNNGWIDSYDWFMKKGSQPQSRKTVYQYTLNDEYIGEHETTQAAAESCGKPKTSKSGIIKACNGKKKTAFGYKWSYIKY